jgi:hypothetical protein
MLLVLGNDFPGSKHQPWKTEMARKWSFATFYNSASDATTVIPTPRQLNWWKSAWIKVWMRPKCSCRQCQRYVPREWNEPPKHTRRKRDDKQNQKYWPYKPWISIHVKLHAYFLVERLRPTAFKTTWRALECVGSETFTWSCYHTSSFCSYHCKYFSGLRMHTSKKKLLTKSDGDNSTSEISFL